MEIKKLKGGPGARQRCARGASRAGGGQLASNAAAQRNEDNRTLSILARSSATQQAQRAQQTQQAQRGHSLQHQQVGQRKVGEAEDGVVLDLRDDLWDHAVLQKQAPSEGWRQSGQGTENCWATAREAGRAACPAGRRAWTAAIRVQPTPQAAGIPIIPDHDQQQALAAAAPSA